MYVLCCSKNFSVKSYKLHIFYVKKKIGDLVFGKVDVDVGNYFGVTCFWKVEVDFGLWSWVLR
jgi:hypothetical protein